jgi:protein-S-isoprenylcysteine O-methyltransferase Ste14
MRPVPFVWPYWLVFWGVFIWAFGVESVYMRRALAEGGGRGKADAGSMWGVVVGNQMSMVVAVLLAFRVPAATLPSRVAFFWIGVAVLVAGSLLRRHCFKMLGQYFTYEVQVRSDQPVIERGAYRWIRHPSYTAGILMFLGMGLALGNWLSLAVLLVGVIGGYAYRVRIEERALLASMGDRYAAYMKRTRRFVPFIV